MRRSARRMALVVVAGAAALAMGSVVARRPGGVFAAGMLSPRGQPWLAPAPSPEAIACGDGLHPLAGACVAFPSAGNPTRLLVYLHGLYEPGAEAGEMARQQRVAQVATKAGYVVLAPRGRVGVCTTPGYLSKYCWPSNVGNAARGAELAASFAPAVAAIEERAHLERRFVLGFSNGGYFAALLASRALFPADAYVVAHAGPAVSPIPASTDRRPVLLLTVEGDPQAGDTGRLAADLTAAGWAYDAYARDEAHELSDAGIAFSVAFFDQVARGGVVPLDPPLGPRPPWFDPGAVIAAPRLPGATRPR